MDRVLRHLALYSILGLLLSIPSLAESGNGLRSVSGKDSHTPHLGSDSGTNDEIFSTAVFDDGSGPALYAGGLFTMAGEISARRIAKWDGTTWSALDRGLTGGVFALTVFDDRRGPAFYVGGLFNHTAGESRGNYIARWDSARWSTVGSGLINSDAVYALTVFDNGTGPALYVGGNFGGAGDVPAKAIAQWDGTTWSDLHSGMSRGDTVFALTVFNDGSGSALFVGGTISTAGGSPANNVAKWDGTSWSAVGREMRAVNTLTVFDDGDGPALYAGGDFRREDGGIVHAVTKWDGARWSVVGRVMDEPPLPSVDCLAAFDDGNGPALYAGGTFTTTDGVRANNIAKWDGTSWSALGRGADNGLSDGVNTLTVFDDGSGPALYVAGRFTAAGRVRAHYIARWDGTSWSALGRGRRR